MPTRVKARQAKYLQTMEECGQQKIHFDGNKKANGMNNNINGQFNYNQQYRNNLLSTVEVTFSNTPCEEYNDDNDDDKLGCNAAKKFLDYSDKRKLSVDLENGKQKIRLKGAENSDKDTDSYSILSTSTAITTNKKKTNIDGGYGWVVVFASFFISLIVDGISFSFGLIFTELLHYFQESKSKTAWIGALFLAVPLLAGPILSNLVDKYGCRRMTFIGGLLAGTGFALASVSNSIEMLYVTFGLIAGIGIGLAYVTAVVSIAFWFDKKSKLR